MSNPAEAFLDRNRVTTGISGLDDVLCGGLTANRVYLVEGNPGSGKTTLALQFLLEGSRLGEQGLYVTLSETKEELLAVADSHGWSLGEIPIFELNMSEESLKPDSQYTMFHPAEVELNETTRAVLGEVERLRPTRVVFDSLSEMRLLAQSSFRYRRQILALKQFFIGRHCTVLLLDDRTADAGDENLQLQSLAHGVVTLEQLAPEYGSERRRLRVRKMRGSTFRGGYHDFMIRKGGLDVFPRLVAAEHRADFQGGQMLSGVAELDQLLGGGVDRGTSTLIVGPAGSGKSTLAIRYAITAAEQGQSAAFFTFDENLTTLLTRTDGLGFDSMRRYAESGQILLQQVDPAELAPGEFAQVVRQAVEERHAKVIVLDSLNGYLNAMPEERYLTIQLHELLTYLGTQGVVTILVVAQHGIVGGHMQSPVDASYLADTVILLRYFEFRGEVRQAISVMKKRSGKHERTIREFALSSEGIHIGSPLRNFHGVLTGTPHVNGGAAGEMNEFR